jgi:metal-responsive CopG/Arc/MetJ family transcriptional regulator
MKTAISLPDETYEQATRKAAELGISRSEFFARAARRYLDDLAAESAESLTEQINEALEVAGADDTEELVVAAGRRHLAQETDW